VLKGARRKVNLPYHLKPVILEQYRMLFQYAVITVSTGALSVDQGPVLETLQSKGPGRFSCTLPLDKTRVRGSG